MDCPKCHSRTKVLVSKEHSGIQYRQRRCDDQECNHRFMSVETLHTEDKFPTGSWKRLREPRPKLTNVSTDVFKAWKLYEPRIKEIRNE
jgi:hypothetical protein